VIGVTKACYECVRSEGCLDAGPPPYGPAFPCPCEDEYWRCYCGCPSKDQGCHDGCLVDAGAGCRSCTRALVECAIAKCKTECEGEEIETP